MSQGETQQAPEVSQEDGLEFLRRVAKVFQVRIEEAEKRAEEELSPSEREERGQQDLDWAAPDQTGELLNASVRARETLGRGRKFLTEPVALELQNKLVKLEEGAKLKRAAAIKVLPSDTSEEALASDEKFQAAVREIAGQALAFSDFSKSVVAAQGEAEKNRTEKRSQLESLLKQVDQRRVEVSSIRFRLEGPSPDEQNWHNVILDVTKLLKDKPAQPDVEQAVFDQAAGTIESKLRDFKAVVEKKATELKGTFEKAKESGPVHTAQLELDEATKALDAFKQQKTKAQETLDRLNEQARTQGMSGQFSAGSQAFYQSKVNGLTPPANKKKLTKEEQTSLSGYRRLLTLATSWTEQNGLKDAATSALPLAEERQKQAIRQHEEAVEELENRVFDKRGDFVKGLRQLNETLNRIERRSDDLLQRKLLEEKDASLAVSAGQIKQLGEDRRYAEALDKLAPLTKQADAELERLKNIEEKWEQDATQGLLDLGKLADPAGLKHDAQRKKNVDAKRKEIADALQQKPLQGDIVKKALDTNLPKFRELIAQVTQELEAIIGPKKVEAKKKFADKVGKSGFLKDEEALDKLLDNLFVGIGPEAEDLTAELEPDQVLEVYDKFDGKSEEGMEKFNSFLKQGLGGPKVLKGMLGTLTPTTLHAVSEAFPNRSELNEIVEAFDPEQGEKLNRVLGNLGNNAGKLKSQFHAQISTISDDTERKRVLKAASTFRKTAVPSNPKAPVIDPTKNPRNLKVTGTASRQHFLERHTRAHFDVNQVPKPDNTQWPEGTNEDSMATYLKDAIEEAANHNNQTVDGGYVKQKIPLKTLGIWVQIGYYQNSKEITQFFPIPASRMSAGDANMSSTDYANATADWPDPPSVALEDFDQATMQIIINAIK